eukprot:3223342-Lingulodinium_polyedra.AAC.1
MARAARSTEHPRRTARGAQCAAHGAGNRTEAGAGKGWSTGRGRGKGNAARNDLFCRQNRGTDKG